MRAGSLPLEYEKFYLVTVYTPNSQDGLKRLDYRMEWEKAFLAYLKKLEEKKPVIFCGDLNVAHQEIDLKNPKTNRKNAGFTDEERAKFADLLEEGFVDTFRYFYPDENGSLLLVVLPFSCQGEERRVAYRLFSAYLRALKDRAEETQKSIRRSLGSDHCPVERNAEDRRDDSRERMEDDRGVTE